MLLLSLLRGRCGERPGVRLRYRRDDLTAPLLRSVLHRARKPVHLAGGTTDPTGPGVTRQARNLGFTRLFERTLFLIHDRDSKFSAAFDEVFRGEDIKVIHTPVRASRANACAERFVCPVRAECLDWLLIPGRRRPPRTCAPPVASTATPSGRTEHSPSSHLQIATSASSPPRTRSSGMTSSAD